MQQYNKTKIMKTLVLKQDIVDKIKTDPILYGKVASALGLSPTSLVRLLYAQSEKLTQANVVLVLREYLNIKKDSELFVGIAAAA